MAMAARTAASARIPRRSAERRAVTDIPPAAAQGAEECRGIREALRIGLHLAERSALVLLLGRQYLQLRILACVVFRRGQLLILERGLESPVVRRVAVGIVLQGLQGVRHVDESRYHGAPVSRERLRIALFGLVFPGRESAAMEHGG